MNRLTQVLPHLKLTLGKESSWMFVRSMATYVDPIYPNPQLFRDSEKIMNSKNKMKPYEDIESIDDDPRDRPLPSIQYEPVNWIINQIAKDPEIANRMHEYYKRCIMKLPPTTRKEFFFAEKMKLREIWEGDWPVLPDIVAPSTLPKDSKVELWDYNSFKDAVLEGKYKKSSSSEISTGSNGTFTKKEADILEANNVHFDIEALRSQVDLYKKQTKSEKSALFDDHDVMSVIINTRGVTRTTAQGRMRKETCLVVCGNTHGAVGLGYGKDREFSKASLKSINEARKNMICVELYEDRTLYSELHGRFNSTEVDIYPARRGYGIVANDIAWSVLYCLGVTDAIVKVHGNGNPFTTVQAIFNALGRAISAEEFSLNTGQRYIDVMHLRNWQNKI